jgi:rod shape-determining protein MreD
MKINRKFVVKCAVYALIYIFLIVLETNIFNDLKIFGAKPNLVISLCIAASILENERYGAGFGFICGFIMDSTFDSPFLFSGIYYFFAAYISGIISRLYFQKSIVTMVILTAPALAVRGIFNMFFLACTWQDFEIITVLSEYLLPEYIYSFALAPFVYFIVKLTAARINCSNV